MTENKRVGHEEKNGRDAFEGRPGTPPRGRDHVFGVYVGDLADLRRYLGRLLGREQAFDENFFDEKYQWLDPFGYGDTAYDHLRGAMVRFGLGGRPWARVCEVGAGEGFLTRHYANLAEEMTLIDLSSRALQRARKLIDRPGKDLAGDALEGLRQLADGSLDAVVIAEILYYASPNPFSRYGRALRREVVRVTRPGGRVVLLHPFGTVLHAGYRHDRSLRVRNYVRVTTTRSLEMLSLDRV